MPNSQLCAQSPVSDGGYKNFGLMSYGCASRGGYASIAETNVQRAQFGFVLLHSAVLSSLGRQNSIVLPGNSAMCLSETDLPRQHPLITSQIVSLLHVQEFIARITVQHLILKLHFKLRWVDHTKR